MTDIAAKAGVSQSTVSFVLNGRETSVRISENTRQRVLAAAEELGYRSNHLARAIRTGNTNMLGFIGGDLGEEHVGQMLDGALEEAEKHGFTLKILPHRDDQDGNDQIVRRASQLRLTGVAALHLPLEMLELLRAETKHCNYAMVLLDTPETLDGVSQVITDDERGVFLAVEHLVRLGHTRIALISGDSASTLAVLREQAFRRAMNCLGIEIFEEWVVQSDFRSHEINVQAARHLLDGPAAERPTAILCIADLIACIAVQVACELGLRVPRDISIVGFGDSRLSSFMVPALTTIHQPFRDMGRRAVQRLIEQAEAQSGQRAGEVGVEGEVERLPVQLIARDSTCPPLRESILSNSSRDKTSFDPKATYRSALI